MKKSFIAKTGLLLKMFVIGIVSLLVMLFIPTGSKADSNITNNRYLPDSDWSTIFFTSEMLGGTENPDYGLSISDYILPTAIDISDSSATLTSIAYGSEISKRGFEYGPSSAYSFVISQTGSNLTGRFQIKVSNLICDTLYHYRAFAENAYGRGHGEDFIFVTQRCPVMQMSVIQPEPNVDTSPDSSTIVTPDPVTKYNQNLLTPTPTPITSPSAVYSPVISPTYTPTPTLVPNNSSKPVPSPTIYFTPTSSPSPTISSTASPSPSPTSGQLRTNDGKHIGFELSSTEKQNLLSLLLAALERYLANSR